MLRYFLLLSFMVTSLFSEEVPQTNKKKTVVLIHGLGSGKSMRTFNRILRLNNWNVILYDYPSHTKTIEYHANKLATLLKEHDNNGEPYNFIAFSMGGLVLRGALNDPQCPPEAKEGRIVVISSPLNGSKMARRLWNFPLGRSVLGKHTGKQMAQTPEYGFDYLGQFPEETPLLIISGNRFRRPFFNSENDGIVSTRESCPQTPHKHEFVASIHRYICRNIDTVNRAINFIESDTYNPKCPLCPQVRCD